MDIKEIRELVQMMDEMNLSTIEICEGDKKIKLEKNKVNIESTSPEEDKPPTILSEIERAQMDMQDSIMPGASKRTFRTEVKSPMVGVFYSAATPGGEAYVAVGDRVQRGDVICIIEAMKLMNEIAAETDGVIAKICAEDGQVVEFGQVLFEIE